MFQMVDLHTYDSAHRFLEVDAPAFVAERDGRPESRSTEGTRDVPARGAGGTYLPSGGVKRFNVFCQSLLNLSR